MAIKKETIEVLVCDICGRNHMEVDRFLGINPNEGCNGDRNHALSYGPSKNVMSDRCQTSIRGHKMHICGFCVESLASIARR